jgi:bisdemethoxycurcumin synthase
MYIYAGQNSGTEKRFFHHDEALLAAHPEFLDRTSPSLDARLDIVKTAVPELAASASRKAIAEWGRPAADITHLVVATNSGAHIPGVDFRLVQLLGLRASVRRTMLYLNGCFAGAAALRVAKDLAENNSGARVLVVCAELTIMMFAAPEEGHFQTLINQGHFGDGAGAVIVGADPGPAERPLLEIMSAAQTIIPETEDAITMQVTSGGLGGSSVHNNLGVLVGSNVERCLLNSFSPLGIDVPNWNDLFWVVHPGTAAMLRQIDAVFQLQPDKLAASRRVLRDYGNMFGATVIFVLDEMCKHRHRGGGSGPGSGSQVVDGHLDEWGVLMAFGPGITFETLVLHAPNNRLHNGKYSLRSKL